MEKEVEKKFKNMNTPIRDIIEDFVLLNGAFAARYRLSWRDTFNYLKQYGGLDFFQKHYAYEHTQSYDSTIDTLVRVCKNNGGTLE
jgi:hypothetical protein